MVRAANDKKEALWVDKSSDHQDWINSFRVIPHILKRIYSKSLIISLKEGRFSGSRSL